MKRRIFKLAGCTLATFLLSTSVNAATFTVDTTLDGMDTDVSDDTCLTESGTCSLRAAIMQANATAGADIIDLTAMNDPASPIVLTIEGVDEVTTEPAPGSEAACDALITPDASIGDLDITQDLEIIGAGPALTIIEWANQSLTDPNVGDRIFHMQAAEGVTVNLIRLADLMLRNGSVGIPNTTDPANVYNCEVTGEPGAIIAWQFKRVGGAVAVGPGAAVFLFEEELHGPGGGGGGDEGGPPDDPGGDEGRWRRGRRVRTCCNDRQPGRLGWRRITRGCRDDHHRLGVQRQPVRGQRWCDLH